MPLPSRLQLLVGTTAFWSNYFGDEVFGQQVEGLPDDSFFDLPLTPNCCLRVGYFWSGLEGDNYIGATQLQLHVNNTQQDILLGWRQDDGHTHPHVLRWEEADLIGRLQAINDPELPHPGIPFLLLLPYIASIEGSDHLLGLKLLQTALRSLGLFSERQIQYRLCTYNKVPAISQWQRVPDYGWVCQFKGSYSWKTGLKNIHSLRNVPKTRSPNWPEFPFKLWSECMLYAERVVSESPQASIERLTSITLPMLYEVVELHYQITNSEEAYATLTMIKQSIFQEGLGVCYLLGSWSAFETLDTLENDSRDQDGGDEYVLECYGDLEEVIAIIYSVIQEVGRPNIRLYLKLARGSQPPYRRIML